MVEIIQEAWYPFCDFFTLSISTTGVIALIFIVQLINSRLKYENEINKIPGPWTIPLLGNFPQLSSIYFRKWHNKRLNEAIFTFEFCQGLCSLYRKERMCRIWCMNKTVVFLFGSNTVESIIASTVSINKGYGYDFFKAWTGNGILTSGGDYWRRQKKMLNPAFHHQILKDFIPTICNLSKKLVDHIKEKPNTNDINVSPLISSISLDIMCETNFEYRLNCLEDPDFKIVEALDSLPHYTSRRMVRPWYWMDQIYFYTAEGREFLKKKKVVTKVTEKMVAEKKTKRIDKIRDVKIANVTKDSKRNTLLDLLIEKQLEDSRITNQDILDEVHTFIIAGSETSANGLTWALYLLGLHPEIQDKAYHELIEVLGEKNTDINYEALQQLQYLDCIVKESLRLYPSIPGFARELEEDMNIGGYKISKGTTIIVDVAALHRDPIVFPNPEIFDPDRFSSSNVDSRPSNSYIPFSGGIRNCIVIIRGFRTFAKLWGFPLDGHRFAMLEIKIVLAQMLLNYQLQSMEPRDKVYPFSEIALKANKSVIVSFLDRTKSLNNL